MNSDNLYQNFEYIDYDKAKKLNKIISNEDIILIKQFEERLKKLKQILEKNNIIPIIITQIKFDGIKDKKLFLLNEKLKDFSEKNNFQLIKLDEIVKMNLYDFYDEIHTTPKGSQKIADELYPYLKKILVN